MLEVVKILLIGGSMDFLNDDYVYNPPEEHFKLVEEYRQKKKAEKKSPNLPVNVPKEIITKTKKQSIRNELLKVVQFNDTHVPFQDDKTLRAIFKFIKDFQPDKVVIAGDFLDFYELSRFDKNPARLHSLQDEIDTATAILSDLRNLLPEQSEIHFIKGNHEKRLKRTLWTDAKALASLRCLDFEALMKFKELGIIYHDEKYILNGLKYHHGSVARQGSGASARAEHAKYGSDLSQGHSHRVEAFYKTDSRGMTASFNMGCTCLLEPEYIEGIPDWQQAIGVFHFIDDRYFCQQVPIIHNKFIYDGKLFDGRFS